MIEGIDYCFIYLKDEKETVQIRFLTGPYKDTIYKYGKVTFKEIDGEMHLIFAYDVVESSVDKPIKLEKNEDFKNYIGNLLVNIMSANIDEEVYDETGTNNSEQSDL